MLNRILFHIVTGLLMSIAMPLSAYSIDDYTVKVIDDPDALTAHVTLTEPLYDAEGDMFFLETYLSVGKSNRRAGCSIFFDFLEPCFVPVNADSLIYLQFSNNGEKIVLFDYPTEQRHGHQLILQTFAADENRTRSELVCGNMSILASKNIEKIYNAQEAKVIDTSDLKTSGIFREMFDLAFKALEKEKVSLDGFKLYCNKGQKPQQSKQTGKRSPDNRNSAKTSSKAAQPDPSIIKMLSLPMGKETLKVDMATILPNEMLRKLNNNGYDSNFDYWDFPIIRIKTPKISLCGHDVRMWWIKMEIPKTEMCYCMNFADSKTAIAYAEKLAATLNASGITTKEQTPYSFLKIFEAKYRNAKIAIYASKGKGKAADVNLHVTTTRTYDKNAYRKTMSFDDAVAKPFGFGEAETCGPYSLVERLFINSLYPGGIINGTDKKRIYTSYGNGDDRFTIHIPLPYSKLVPGLVSTQLEYLEKGDEKAYVATFEPEEIKTMTFNQLNEEAQKIYKSLTAGYKKGKAKALKVFDIEASSVKECRITTSGNVTRYILLINEGGSYRIKAVSVCG